MQCWTSRIIILALISAVIIRSATKAQEDGYESETERIVGGKSAAPGQFPWVIALYYNGVFICTGSIISPTTILTAAHCVVIEDAVQQPVFFFAIAGNVNRSSPVYRVEFTNINVHPDYDGFENDIAILKTTAPIPFNNSNLQPICISRPNTRPLEYKRAIAMGWGNTKRTRPYTEFPDNLQYTKQIIVSNLVCSILYGPLSESKMCAKGLASGICSGDSGGPLVHLSAKKPPVQIGIASYINSYIGCGKTIGCAVFTRTSSFYDFIMQASGDGMVCSI